MEWIWTCVFILTLVIEIFSAEIISIWFSAGSLVAFILSLCGVNVTIQIIVFLVVSVVLLACLRTICMKFLKNSKEKTNLDSLIGTTHKLLSPISEESLGEIKINGIIWRVESKNNEAIEKGEKIKILEVTGNKFIVEKEK